jgi:ABC-type proline/glycine betaine transport system permease subunit
MATSAAAVTMLGELALLLMALPLYGLGWLAGVIVRVTLWTVAAIVEGYQAGLGK